ncbi:WhiB family transcriptional regulator [Streptacidiphilus sp. PAMC 29251]
MTDVSRLPGPFQHQWDWQSHGACREADSGIFFHPAGERGESLLQRDQAAKQVCARCPVLLACRRYALEAEEPYGVWGGLSEDERLARTGGTRHHRRRRTLAG